MLITSSPSLIHEPSISHQFPYSERHLQCVWFDSKLRPKNLITSKGETMKVIDPGRWNQESGPDFLDAVLLLGPERRRIQGDVEIHINPNDWNNHKHGQDAHFNKVIAHVTYTPANKPVKSLPAGAIEISLKKALAATPSFSFESIDITAYPYSVLPDNPRPCFHAVKNMPQDKIETILEAAGARRIQIKAARIAAKLKHNPPDQVLYQEMLGALGYKHNTAICRQLANIVTYNIISDLPPLEGYALLLGVSGLIPSKPSIHWDNPTKSFVRKLWDIWWPQQTKWQNSILSKKYWKLSSIRPQNHPIRRLSAAAAFACNSNSPAKQIADKLIIQTDNFDKHHFQKMVDQYISDIFTAQEPLDYWHNHISLASPQRKKPIAIIGKSRIAAIKANIIIPFLAASGYNITHLTENLPPEQSNIIIRQTAHALLGRDHNPNLYSKNGMRQQGLIQIFHDFCINDRSNCKSCPLPQALKRSF